MDYRGFRYTNHFVHLILELLCVHLFTRARILNLQTLDTIGRDLETLGALTIDLCRKPQCARLTLD